MPLFSFVFIVVPRGHSTLDIQGSWYTAGKSDFMLKEQKANTETIAKAIFGPTKRKLNKKLVGLDPKTIQTDRYSCSLEFFLRFLPSLTFMGFFATEKQKKDKPFQDFFPTNGHFASRSKLKNTQNVQ